MLPDFLTNVSLSSYTVSLHSPSPAFVLSQGASDPCGSGRAGDCAVASAFARVPQPAALPLPLLHRLLLLSRSRPQALGAEAQHARLHAAASHLLSTDARAYTLLPLTRGGPPHPAAPGAALGAMAAELKRAPSLAGVMEELGYGCAQGEAAIREVLSQFDGALDEAAVAEVSPTRDPAFSPPPAP